MMRTGWWMLLWMAACAPSPTEPGLVDRLVGSWRWVDATGGIAGVTRTPETDGTSIILRFLDEDDVERVDDGDMVVRTHYTITVAAAGGTEVIHYESPLFGFDSQTVTIQPGDTLVLVDPCCDGFTYRFAREGG